MKNHKAYLRIEKGLLDGFKIHDVIPLNETITIFGRSGISKNELPGSEFIKINDEYISRGHIRIVYDSTNNTFVIRERSSGTTNGTFINEEILHEDQSLHLQDGDLIQLAKINGKFRVIFKFRESEETVAEYLAIEGTVDINRSLEIDHRARRVYVNGSEVVLRKKEFDLLSYLYINKGKACSKDEIAQEVWKPEGGYVSQETIEQNISRIRRAINLFSSKDQFITTIHGGYRLDLN